MFFQYTFQESSAYLKQTFPPTMPCSTFSPHHLHAFPFFFFLGAPPDPVNACDEDGLAEIKKNHILIMK